MQSGIPPEGSPGEGLTTVPDCVPLLVPGPMGLWLSLPNFVDVMLGDPMQMSSGVF